MSSRVQCEETPGARAVLREPRGSGRAGTVVRPQGILLPTFIRSLLSWWDRKQGSTDPEDGRGDRRTMLVGSRGYTRSSSRGQADRLEWAAPASSAPLTAPHALLAQLLREAGLQMVSLLPHSSNGQEQKKEGRQQPSQ